MALSLVVLAAGMGSRYGGLKQIDPVGPSGETVLDYAVFDARRAGFDRVVFVIRRDFEAQFRERTVERYGGQIELDYVFQSLDALPVGFMPPPGREKPWGTGHAVWCARDAIRGNFAVINADDFYGADSFTQLANFLRAPKSPTARAEFAMVGFRLANTLSENGAVSRGVCTAGADGALISIIEQTNIAAADVGQGKKFSGTELVSMNCWGFTPELFDRLDLHFREFLKHRGGDAKAEFYLPTTVSTLIQRDEAHVRVLTTESSWFGITYREDKPRVEEAIGELVQAGIYPDRLF
jgi:NDP-sugar pyrophosphorylase family protein